MPRFLLVDTHVLPEIFIKVIEAKRMIARGEAKNSTEAIKKTGISRSAFYKYKDTVMIPTSEITQSVINFSVTLKDEPGQLSKLVSVFHKLSCNIISINQNPPVDSVAQVSATVKVSGMEHADEKILNKIKNLPGVVDAKLISVE